MSKTAPCPCQRRARCPMHPSRQVFLPVAHSALFPKAASAEHVSLLPLVLVRRRLRSHHISAPRRPTWRPPAAGTLGKLVALITLPTLQHLRHSDATFVRPLALSERTSTYHVCVARAEFINTTTYSTPPSEHSTTGGVEKRCLQNMVPRISGRCVQSCVLFPFLARAACLRYSQVCFEGRVRFVCVCSRANAEVSPPIGELRRRYSGASRCALIERMSSTLSTLFRMIRRSPSPLCLRANALLPSRRRSIGGATSNATPGRPPARPPTGAARGAGGRCSSS